MIDFIGIKDVLLRVLKRFIDFKESVVVVKNCFKSKFYVIYFL